MEGYQDWLAHHGIKGMEWGKRNGPPYPLDDGQRSGKENKLNPTSRSSKKLAKEGQNNRFKRNRAKKKEKKLMANGNKLAETHARLEDMTRELTSGVKPGSRILVPTDVKKMYSDLLYEYEKAIDEIIKNYGDNYSSRVITKNGEDYIETLIFDKETNNWFESELKLLNQFNK